MRWLRRLVGLFLLLAVLVLGAGLALDAWIESSGGRRMVERTLSEASGLPVRLGGDFDVRLFPPGASGTDFRVLDESADTEVVRSRVYELELELLPLLRRELRVERLRLEWLVLGEAGGQRFALPAVEVSDFALGQPSHIAIDLGWLGAVEALVSWFPDQSRVDFGLAWSAAGREDIGLEATLEYAPAGLFLPDLSARIEGQLIWGSACFLTAGAPVAALDLEADTLDLAALEAVFPAGQGGAVALPFELNLRLRAGTLLRGDIRASDTLLEVGAPPDCSPAAGR
jgi:hypothetical protein